MHVSLAIGAEEIAQIGTFLLGVLGAIVTATIVFDVGAFIARVVHGLVVVREQRMRR